MQTMIFATNAFKEPSDTFMTLLVHITSPQPRTTPPSSSPPPPVATTPASLLLPLPLPLPPPPPLPLLLPLLLPPMNARTSTTLTPLTTAVVPQAPPRDDPLYDTLHDPRLYDHPVHDTLRGHAGRRTRGLCSPGGRGTDTLAPGGTCSGTFHETIAPRK